MSIFAGSNAKIHMSCEHPWMLAVYESVPWNIHHAKVFWNKAWKHQKFNFGHVLEKFNKHEIITTLPERKNFVVPLSDLKIHFD